MFKMETSSNHLSIKFPDFNEKEIYFDTLNEAILTTIEGKFFDVQRTKIFISEGLEPLINSQIRLESLESLGKEIN